MSKFQSGITMRSATNVLPVLLAALLLASSSSLFAAPESASPGVPQPLSGDVAAARSLIDRLLLPANKSPALPAPSDHFDLQLLGGDQDCASGVAPPCFGLADGLSRIQIRGTRASELTAGLGFYLRHYCNMTIGWPRGGGSNVFVPDVWPSIGPTPLVKHRNAPYSYIMNVCTHSYSLVWYGWNEWEQFIDWMALSGINLMLAMTGQEEVQYKVFRRLGLEDADIRSWFNGPALLTWSRGQNEYGSGLLGPRQGTQGGWTPWTRCLERLPICGWKL